MIKLAPDAPITSKLDSDFRIEGAMEAGGRSPVNRTETMNEVMYQTKSFINHRKVHCLAKEKNSPPGFNQAKRYEPSIG